MDMLQTVIRPSIDISRNAVPRYSMTWPIPPPVPIVPMIASTTSLGDTPAGSEPSTSTAIHRGRTWAVTRHGIERHAGAVYTIEKTRLLKKRGNLLDWPIHMAEKGPDYDFIDFLHCFIKAFDLFEVEVVPDMLRDSIEKGLAEHLKHIGCSLRDLHREPIEQPIRAKALDTKLSACAARAGFIEVAAVSAPTRALRGGSGSTVTVAPNASLPGPSPSAWMRAGYGGQSLQPGPPISPSPSDFPSANARKVKVERWLPVSLTS